MVTVFPFDSSVAALSAREFLKITQENLRMKGLIIGPDFALGRGREGDFDALCSLGREMGFTVEKVPPLVLDGMVVSSTTVRKAIALGDVRLFQKLVGRYYALNGEVIRGAERGRHLGFPTANLALPPERATPANGVYASWAYIHGERCAAATNIGVRPTFDNGQRLAEVYILDFEGDIYGRELCVELVEKLRDELRFSSVDELKEQMKLDVLKTKELLVAEARAK